MLPYWMFADRFHWPPSVVRQESRLEMVALLRIQEVADEIRRDQQRPTDGGST